MTPDDTHPDPATPIDASLGLPAPAVRGMVGAGPTTLGAATAATDADLLALHGVGPKAVRLLRGLAGPPASPVPAYLHGLDPESRAAFERVRAVVLAAAPEAEEGTSYGMPAFLLGGRPVLGFRAARRHLGVFPFSPGAVEAVRDRLDGFDVSKGTIRFTAQRPLPEDVLTDLVRARLRELAG